MRWWWKLEWNYQFNKNTIKLLDTSNNVAESKFNTETDLKIYTVLKFKIGMRFKIGS